MKKFRNVAVALVLMLCATVVLVACGKTEVAGNTYNFKETKFEWAEGVTEAEKEATGMTVELYNQMLKNYKIEFKNDGTAVITGLSESGDPETIYYKQDGNTLKVYSDAEKTKEDADYGEVKVDGDKMIITTKLGTQGEPGISEDNPLMLTITMTFEKA